MPANTTRPMRTDSGAFSTNVVAAALAASRRGRVDVGGAHRQRDVDGHDHGGPLDRDLLGAGRPGQRDHHRGEPEDEQRGAHVAAPVGTVRRDDVKQVEVREAHRVLRLAQLHRDVDGDQGNGHGQQPQRRGGKELHANLAACGPPRLSPAPRRRRLATKRASSTSQSWSVRSTRCEAPLRRMALAIWRRWA